MEIHSERSSTPTSPSAEQRPRLPEAWTLQLQKRMLSIFGHRFQSLFPDDECMADWRDTWGRALGDLSGEQIAAGLEALTRTTDGWPPTTGEFRAMCKPVRRPEHQRSAYLALPSTKGNEAGELAMAEILAKLRGKKPTTEADDEQT